ncbi:hypothetical protein ACT9XH_07390 [Methanococcoides methylutens]|uniref:hypothetical protein n=1 Tax=Methanococcoides methylutens TaxID=2226 RepID=UPI0040440132
MYSNNLFAFTEKIITYLLPILGVMGIAIPLIIGQSNLSLLGTYLAIPMILAPIVYAKNKNKQDGERLFESNQFMLFVVTYFVCTAISIFLVITSDIRPFTYYIIISIMATMILLQIMETEITKAREKIILLQIMMLILNIIWGVTLNYHFYIHRTDPMGHVWFIQNVINTGYITDVFGMYKPFPLWHILSTYVYEITGKVLSVQKTMFFINGIIYSFIPLVAYLITTKLTQNNKISLIVALFVSLYPGVIDYGMASLSRSVVSFLEILIIMTLLSKDNSYKVLIAIVLTISAIVYHTASMPFIIVILIGIYCLEKIYNQNIRTRIISLNFILLTIVMTLTYWMYNAPVLFESIIRSIARPPAVGTITKSIVYTPMSELFNYLQYTPLLFFIIIGCLICLKTRKNSSSWKIFCLIGLLAVVVTFPGPTLLINKLAGSFNLARFGEYIFLFICMAGGLGYYELHKRSKKHAKLFLIVLFMSMSFLVVSNDFNASDNPIVKRPFYTYYLTEEETITFKHVSSFTSGYLMSDYVSYRYLYFSEYSEKIHIMEASNNANILKNSSEDIILFRKTELEKRPLKLYNASENVFEHNPSWGNNLDYYYKDESLWNTIETYNKIYSSNNVDAFK